MKIFMMFMVSILSLKNFPLSAVSIRECRSASASSFWLFVCRRAQTFGAAAAQHLRPLREYGRRLGTQCWCCRPWRQMLHLGPEFESWPGAFPLCGLCRSHCNIHKKPYTVRKYNWWRYCLALCEEIFDNFPLFDETVRYIELWNSVIRHIQRNLPTLF